MERFTVTREQAIAALRAMKAVAIADGTIGGHEVNLLQAAARALEVEDALDCTPMKPIEVAAKVKDPIARLRVIQVMEMMVIIDGRVDPAELAACEAFARALGLDEPQLRSLRQLTRRNMRTLQLDLLRRRPIASPADVSREHGAVRGLWRLGTASYGGAHDAAIAARYRHLGTLPEGTLGRAYCEHLTDRQFPFPGEHLGLPEELVRHDLAHVVSGYGTDVAGECETAAFSAALLKQDAFAHLFMVAVHTHLDLEVFPNEPSQAIFSLEPERVIAALNRGLAVKRDLYDPAWDHWQEFPRPLADVRADLGLT